MRHCLVQMTLHLWHGGISAARSGNASKPLTDSLVPGAVPPHDSTREGRTVMMCSRHGGGWLLELPGSEKRVTEGDESAAWSRLSRDRPWTLGDGLCPSQRNNSSCVYAVFSEMRKSRINALLDAGRHATQASTCHRLSSWSPAAPSTPNQPRGTSPIYLRYLPFVFQPAFAFSPSSSQQHRP